MAEHRTIAKVTDVEEGRGMTVDLGGMRIALFRVDGEFFAIDDLCTHAHASLAEGDVDGHVVECPLHGAQFDLKTGKVVSAPATEPVRAYPLHVEGDEIQLVIE